MIHSNIISNTSHVTINSVLENYLNSSKHEVLSHSLSTAFMTDSAIDAMIEDKDDTNDVSPIVYTLHIVYKNIHDIDVG